MGAVFIIGVLSVFLISLLGSESPGFCWGVEVGDEFHFDIGVFGFIETDPDHPLDYVPFLGYNNTQIIARITSLPTVAGNLSAAQFIGIVNELKVECVFTNGTEISPNAIEGYYVNFGQTSICEIVSRAILPVGHWNLVDRLFPDEPENPWWCNTYLSDELGASMYFGYRYANVDAGSGWSTYVNLTSGMPLTVTHWELSAHTGSWIDYRVAIELV